MAEHDIPGFDDYGVDDADFDESPSTLEFVELPRRTVRQMGRTGIKEYRDLPQPPIDVQIDGIEPAHYARAGVQLYDKEAQVGLNIIEDEKEESTARKYLSSLFPQSEFSFLGDGHYGVVMADETGKAYKLYRSSFFYSRVEKEAGALKLLSDAGLAPKLHLLVDADEKYRLDQYPLKYQGSGFEGVQIPRQNSGKELPVMVMDKVDAGPLEEATPEQRIDGFCKTADLFIKEDIHAWDTEVMLNRATGKVVILDVGELTQGPTDQNKPKTKQQNEGEILGELCLDFGFTLAVSKSIQDVYGRGGLDAVREYLVEHLQTA